MDKNRIAAHNGRLVLEEVLQVEDRFLVSVDIKDFAELFGIDVKYLDMSLDENKTKHPIDLGVTYINVDNGEIGYNVDEKRLSISGDIKIYEGIKKFDLLRVHPDSKVNLMISTHSKEEIVRLLSSINTIQKTEDKE